MSHRQLLSPDAVAEMAGCTERKVRYAIQCNKLDAYATRNFAGRVVSYGVTDAAAAKWLATWEQVDDEPSA